MRMRSLLRSLMMPTSISNIDLFNLQIWCKSERGHTYNSSSEYRLFPCGSGRSFNIVPYKLDAKNVSSCIDLSICRWYAEEELPFAKGSLKTPWSWSSFRHVANAVLVCPLMQLKPATILNRFASSKGAVGSLLRFPLWIRYSKNHHWIWAHASDYALCEYSNDIV